MNFADMILERRVPYLREIKRRAEETLSGNPEANYKRLMMVPPETHTGDAMDSFLDVAREHPYFSGMHDKIEGREFTWENIEGIEEIAGVTNVYHDRLHAAFQQITSVIDQHFAPLLERMKVFPLFYTSGSYPEGFGIEPNCVSVTSQVLPVLYSYDHDIDDLGLLEVYSTKRRDTLLEKLSEIYEQQRERRISGDVGIEWVKTDFDQFSGLFLPEQIIEMVFDTILFIEDNLHLSLKDNKRGEVFDYKTERDNFKGVHESGVRDGGMLYSYANMLLLMKHLGYDANIVKSEFESIYSGNEDDVFMNAAALDIHRDNPEQFHQHMEKLLKLYGDDVPVSYVLSDAFYRLATDTDNPLKGFQDRMEYIKERYVLPDALERISERYLNDRRAISRYLNEGLGVV